MGLLIVFAALAGYHWGNIMEGGQVYGHDVMLGAVCFTVLAVVVALAIEAAVTRTEIEAASAESLKERKAEESDISRAHARELDRIVSRLSDDNSDLRYQLMSSKLHHVADEMAKPVSSPSYPAWRARAL